ncbi:reticulocalbin-2-like [Littorina saxatilis]|uniref:Reticulocalbin-3 n=1 Tax=Littorina saxatilis TaxID=31220 RepID=A0AAN9BAI7_9CAEN
MNPIQILGAVLVLLGLVLSDEHTKHGPRVPHQSDDGEHNAAFDHEAVLGSEDLEEEFAGLPPEEAKERLQTLAEEHDIDKDGQISKDEMYKWITSSFLNLDQQESNEKFEEEDEDRDGKVSWEEYLKKVYGYNPQDVEELRKTASEDKNEEARETESTLKMVDDDHRMFKAADEDKDGSLNPDEYMAFFYPHNYDHMHQFEIDRYLEQNDGDGDRKITLAEFTPEGASQESKITSKENFADLDKDKDGILKEEELKEWVAPATDELAEDEANHLIEMADTNGDGLLSMEEIVQKTDQFVGSSATDYGNFLRHEEL